MNVIGRRQVWAYVAIGCVVAIKFAPTAAATQPHDYEGYVLHQLAHLLFLFAMGYFVYRVWTDDSLRGRGWRYIGAAAGLFGLWNAQTFIGHHLVRAHDMGWVTVAPTAHDSPVVLSTALEWLIFLLNLDNITVLVALVVLIVGIRTLRQSNEVTDPSH